MATNYLLVYSEQLATDIELLRQNVKAPKFLWTNKTNVNFKLQNLKRKI